MKQLSNTTTPGPIFGQALTAETGSPTGSRILQVIDTDQARMSAQIKDYYSRNRGWLERLFPSELDKVLRDGQLAIAKSDQEITLRLHDLLCGAKFAACHEAAEGWVKSMRVECRQAFIQFVTHHMGNLRATIEEHRIQFNEHIKTRYETAEKFKGIPKLYARNIKSIEDEIESDFGWLDDLLVKFRAIVDEGIDTYSKPALIHR